MAMLGQQCISLTRTRMTYAEEVDLKRHFLQTPDSIVLIGKDAKRKRRKTFGHIHQATTARKCLRAGLYGGSPTRQSTWRSISATTARQSTWRSIFAATAHQSTWRSTQRKTRRYLASSLSYVGIGRRLGLLSLLKLFNCT